MGRWKDERINGQEGNGRKDEWEEWTKDISSTVP